MIAYLLCVVVLVLYAVVLKQNRGRKSTSKGTAVKRTLPGPKPWPVIGSLHLLGKHKSPFEAFGELSKIYGDIYSITLGSTPCVVVNNFQLIREVLINKGADFGDRPDFMRFHMLFGGDRNNSLALCDWSVLQKTRRSIARTYCSPRFTSLQFDNVNQVGSEELSVFLSEMQKLPMGEACNVKPIVMSACANMFMQYMCSTSFPYEDKDFKKLVSYFDEIFWEINEGYAVDFLPWLSPFYNFHMKRLSHWAGSIREFILERIVKNHVETLDTSAPPRDFTDALLIYLEEDPNLEWNHIIYELEDFIGGHSAVGNLVMLALTYTVKNPEVAAKIQEEVDRQTGGNRLPNLFDRNAMPYTEAVLWETLRSSSSPIVPHVASTNSEIEGFEIKKGTMVFLNNYELNLSKEHWENPEQFKPERFISEKNTIVKPEHFIPFSTGKRTCIGQRLVQCFSFIILATLFQNYDITAGENIETKPACLAVSPQGFKLKLTPRFSHRK